MASDIINHVYVMKLKEQCSEAPFSFPYILLCLSLPYGYSLIISVPGGSQTGSKLGKDYVKAAYCYPAYLTYMQSTSYEMPGWIKHKLEIKIARRNINNLSYVDDGEGNGNPLQYSCLENPMDGEAW